MTSRTRLFIGNLSFDTTDESLKLAFESQGRVAEAKVIRDRYSGKSKGFGFVALSRPEEANAALNNMNGRWVDGREIRVQRTDDCPN